MCSYCLDGETSCMPNETQWARCQPKDYYRALSGQIENINLTSLSFGSKSVNDFLGLVYHYRAMTNEDAKDWRAEIRKSLERGHDQLMISYQDPQHICLTKRRKYESNKLLKYQYLKLSLHQLPGEYGETLPVESSYDIQVLVH